MIAVYAEVTPARTRQTIDIIEREAKSLAARGVQPDEFARVKQPFLRERADNLRQLDYWGRTVLAAAQAEPEHIAAARDRATDTAAIVPGEISGLAKRILDPIRSFKFVTVPVAVRPKAGPSSAANSKSAAGTAIR